MEKNKIVDNTKKILLSECTNILTKIYVFRFISHCPHQTQFSHFMEDFMLALCLRHLHMVVLFPLSLASCPPPLLGCLLFSF